MACPSMARQVRLCDRFTALWTLYTFGVLIVRHRSPFSLSVRWCLRGPDCRRCSPTPVSDLFSCWTSGWRRSRWLRANDSRCAHTYAPLACRPAPRPSSNASTRTRLLIQPPLSRLHRNNYWTRVLHRVAVEGFPRGLLQALVRLADLPTHPRLSEALGLARLVDPIAPLDEGVVAAPHGTPQLDLCWGQLVDGPDVANRLTIPLCQRLRRVLCLEQPVQNPRERVIVQRSLHHRLGLNDPLLEILVLEAEHLGGCPRSVHDVAGVLR